MIKNSSKLTLCLAAGLTIGLLGCGPGQVSKADVEANAQQTLTEKAGQPAPPITCPTDLKAEVGATEVCSITLNDKPYDVTVTVSSVENGNASPRS